MTCHSNETSIIGELKKYTFVLNIWSIFAILFVEKYIDLRNNLLKSKKKRVKNGGNKCNGLGIETSELKVLKIGFGFMKPTHLNVRLSDSKIIGILFYHGFGFVTATQNVFKKTH